MPLREAPAEAGPDIRTPIPSVERPGCHAGRARLETFHSAVAFFMCGLVTKAAWLAASNALLKGRKIGILEV